MTGKRVLRNLEGDMAWWAPRHCHEQHAGLFRGAVAFLDIALQAGCHHVIPVIDAAARAREDVVDSEVVPALPAILAGVIVTMQDVASRQADLFVGNLHIAPQPDYGGKSK